MTWWSIMNAPLLFARNAMAVTSRSTGVCLPVSQVLSLKNLGRPMWWAEEAKGT